MLRFLRSSPTTTKGICPWKYCECLTSFSADFCPKFQNSRPNSFAYLTQGCVQVDLTKLVSLVLFVFRLLSFQMIEIGLVKTRGTRLRVLSLYSGGDLDRNLGILLGRLLTRAGENRLTSRLEISNSDCSFRVFKTREAISKPTQLLYQ